MKGFEWQKKKRRWESRVGMLIMIWYLANKLYVAWFGGFWGTRQPTSCWVEEREF